MTLQEELKSIIRDVPNFPKEGIIFKDLSPILLYPDLCKRTAENIIDAFTIKPDAIVGIESRGFWIGPLLANIWDVPFVPIRKKGKLPGDIYATKYDLEYGSAQIEIHKGHLQEGWQVMVHDDLLATGGTALAAKHLIELSGASLHSYNFIVNLEFLGGAKQLDGDIYSVLNY